MSAITPFLEQQDDPAETDVEREWFSRIDPEDLEALGQIEQQFDQRDPAEAAQWDTDMQLRDKALASSHSQLIRTSWMRHAIYVAMEGVFIRLRTVNARDGLVATVKLDLVDANGEKVIITDPPWNRANAGGATLLTWTGKMGAPSFSIPAGPPNFGGSCPGALGGQSIVPVGQLLKAQAMVANVLQKPVDIARCVCQFCYAETGNYSYGTKHVTQMINYLWAKQAVLEGGNFVEVMDWAVKHTDYFLDGDKEWLEGDQNGLPPERHPGRFFRIHDSGDFFSRAYLAAWSQVAAMNPDISFWAPSRLWAINNWVNDVAKSPGIPPNLIIRPSAFMVNDPPPAADLGPGWTAWSVVYAPEQKPFVTPGPHPNPAAYNWDCQAYMVKGDKHNCRRAEAPDGEPGCRACWLNPDQSINYTLH